MAKRKVENIVYDITGRDIPLYPVWRSTFSTKINVDKDGKTLFKKDVEYKICGYSNGVMVDGKRLKWWLIQVKHDISSPEFFVKEADIQKLYDKQILK
jgi:hypothetical protein